MKIKEEDLRRELEVALSGKDSQPSCSFRLGMRLNRFKQLLRRARIHGIDAVLHSNMAGSYTDEFKLIVVNSVINESLTLGSAGARYNLAECTIKHGWENIRKAVKKLFLKMVEEGLRWDGRRNHVLKIMNQVQWNIRS